MNDNNKTIIEINGVKLEVDLRDAKRIDSFRIGDSVKVLVKEYSSYKSYHGVIVGFDDFKKLPTIVVCYLKDDYAASVAFAYVNSETEDIELCPETRPDLIDKATACQKLDREIAKKEAELEELNARKSYFIENFDRHFGTAAE
jgi:hypothetical protein